MSAKRFQRSQRKCPFGIFFVFSLIFFQSSTVFAELESTKNIQKWAGSAFEKDVNSLYQRHKIELEYSKLFTKDEVQSFIKGARSLPRSYFRTLGKPLRVKRISKSCIFGIGRSNKGCPTFDKDGKFLIYNLPPIQGTGPVQRYDQLNQSERIDLQRRRAIVHAIFLSNPALHEWSDEPTWRNINGWSSKQSVLNRDPWGFSRYLGANNPKLDLVTFAETFFVRFQDVTTKKLDPDRSVQCQEFTKARFFKAKTAASDPKWYRNYFSSCPDFDKWANVGNLKSIDVLVAAATSDRPESLYGHLLLHLVYKGKSRGFEPVYQFGAVTDSNVGLISYFVKGLLGGFISVLDVSSYRSTDKRILRSEQRNLKRFKLNLSPQQRVHVLERIWEIERRFRFSYVFFFNNCASFLVDLLGGALDIDFPGRSSFLITPSDVLDTFSTTENGKYGTLLNQEPVLHLSSREVAHQSIVMRRELLKKAKLSRFRNALEGKTAKQRLGGYIDLKEAIKNLGDNQFKLGLDILYHSVEIERFFAEHAEQKERGLKLRNMKIPPISEEEILERRRRIFGEKALENRYEKLFEKVAKIEETLIESDLLPDEKTKDARLWIAETRNAYINITDLMGDYIEAYQPEFDGSAYLEERRQVGVQAARQHDKKSIGPSGKGRISIGLQSEETFGEGLRLRFEGAVIKERLGEQRRRGFRSDVESVVLDFQTNFSLSDRIFQDIEMDLTIIRFLSMAQKVGPIREGFFDWFGWGFDVGGHRVPRLGLDASLKISGGLVAPFFGAPKYTSFFVMGLFPELRMDFGQNGKHHLLGGGMWARLQIHLFDLFPNILELQLASKHFFDVPTTKYRYEHNARLGLQFVPFFSGDKPAFIRPFFSTAFTNMVYKREQENEDLDFRVGLDFELPF